MAEWGKYLKNAVANVEQQLDRVLLENQDDKGTPLLSKPRTRPDLSERLKLAATGKADATARSSTSQNDSITDTDNQEGGNNNENRDISIQITENTHITEQASSSATDSAATTEQLVDLLTLKSFANPPDMINILIKARKVALLVKRDDTLALVDDLERTNSDLNAYTKHTTEKLQSLHSKLTLMCSERAKAAQGPEKQVALLMEEGQRLSQQELKLGMLVKKLRGELRDSQSRLSKCSDQNVLIEKLNHEISQARTQNNELEALVANYRAQLNEVPMNETDSESRSNFATGNDLQKYVMDRENWHRLETQLLKRISELEQDSSLRHISTSQLQQSLAEAQRQNREARDQIVELQDELDAVKLNSKQEVDAMRQELVAIKNESPITEIITEPISRPNEDQLEPVVIFKNNSSKNLAQRSTSPQMLTDSHDPITILQLSPTSSPATGIPPEVSVPDRALSVPKQSTFYSAADLSPGIVEHDPFTLIPDEQIVGPSGPFGGGLNDHDSIHIPEPDDGLYGIENEEPSFASRRSVDSLSLWGNRSRQESVVNSLNEGANSHLIKKLTLSVRRLQNDLSAAKQDAQLARQQRQEAQTEIVKYLHLQEKLNTLENLYSRLEVSQRADSGEIEKLRTLLTNKTEIVEELEADIRDLKDVYRDQVETLVGEIEKLRH